MGSFDDPRTVMSGALEQAGVVVAGVKPDQYGDPTPCTKFDVATLVNHLTGAVDRAAGIARGVPVTGELVVDSSEPESGFAAAFESARRSAESAWADDALLTKEYTLPWATLPGAGIVTMYTLETILHTWDLAVSTGQDHVLDDALAEAVFPTAREMLPPEHRGGEIPFEAVVEVPAEAGATDRLAGFSGRRRP